MIDRSSSYATAVPRRERHSTRRIARYLLLFVAWVLVLNALVGERGLLATLTADRQHSELSALIMDLRNENGSLRDEVRRLREEPKAIEEIARRDLGLIRTGERLFIVTTGSVSTESNSDRAVSGGEP